MKLSRIHVIAIITALMGIAPTTYAAWANTQSACTNSQWTTGGSTPLIMLPAPAAPLKKHTSVPNITSWQAYFQVGVCAMTGTKLPTCKRADGATMYRCGNNSGNGTVVCISTKGRPNAQCYTCPNGKKVVFNSSPYPGSWTFYCERPN